MEQEILPIIRTMLDTLNVPTGAEKASEILDTLSQNKQNDDLLKTLSDASSDVAKTMVGKLIKFNDLAKWPNETIQIILRHTPKNIALVSLVNADPAVIGAISRNIPEDMWPQIAKEISTRKQTAEADILSARQKVLEIIQSLLRAGKIQL